MIQHVVLFTGMAVCSLQETKWFSTYKITIADSDKIRAIFKKDVEAQCLSKYVL